MVPFSSNSRPVKVKTTVLSTLVLTGTVLEKAPPKVATVCVNVSLACAVKVTTTLSVRVSGLPPEMVKVIVFS